MIEDADFRSGIVAVACVVAAKVAEAIGMPKVLGRWISEVVESRSKKFFYCYHCKEFHLAEIFLACVASRRKKPMKRHWRKPYVKKPIVSEASGGSKLALADEASLKKYPTLVEYLTTLRWEDGTDRKPSSLSIFVEDGAWKVAVNDKDLQRSLYISGETLQDALGSVEKALRGENADWRAWNAAKGKKRG